MDIYISTKVAPYVYFCTNRITNEFYIGYREANKEPSHIDFPKYKTSSRKVKNSFEQFNWYIVAEFFDCDSAYDFEQQLIYENWSNPLLLNDYHQFGKAKFKKSNKGIDNPNYGKRGSGTTSFGKHWTLTEEQCIARRGENSPSFGKPGGMTGKFGELHHHYGKSNSEESNKKRSDSAKGLNKGKVTVFDKSIELFVSITSDEYKLHKNIRYISASSNEYKVIYKLSIT